MRATNLLLVTVLVALLQFATSDSIENVVDCSKQANGIRLVDPSSCTNFIICYNQRPVRRACARGLYFDDTTLNCNYAALVKCSRYSGASNEVKINDLPVENLAEKCTCAPTVPTTCTCNTPVVTCIPPGQTNTEPCTCTEDLNTPYPNPTPCYKDVNWGNGNNPYPYPYPPPPPPPSYPYWNIPWHVPCWTPCTTPCPVATTTAAATTNSTEKAVADYATYVLDEKNPRKYYVIQNGNATPMKCSLTQMFDLETKTCRNKSYFKKK